MTSAPSFQTAGVHSPSIPCLAPSLGPLHPLFPSTPCPAPSPVALHPLSPSIPCRLPSLVSLHPLSRSILCLPALTDPLCSVPSPHAVSHRSCPRAGCGVYFRHFCWPGHGVFQRWGSAPAAAKTQAGTVGHSFIPLLPGKGHMCGPCAHPMGWCGGVNPSCCCTEGAALRCLVASVLSLSQ